ncbi:hypothetical protein D9M71_443860 [compost metagenome]
MPGQNQRQLARVVAVGEIAWQGRIDQRDIARTQRHALAVLLHGRMALQLERGEEMPALALLYFAPGAIETSLSDINETQLDRADLVLLYRAGKVGPQGSGTKTATGLVDLLQPFIKTVCPERTCSHHDVTGLSAIFIISQAPTSSRLGYLNVRQFPRHLPRLFKPAEAPIETLSDLR